MYFYNDCDGLTTLLRYFSQVGSVGSQSYIAVQPKFFHTPFLLSQKGYSDTKKLVSVKKKVGSCSWQFLLTVNTTSKVNPQYALYNLE